MTDNRRIATKGMLEAFCFARTGDDMPVRISSLDPTIQNDLINLERVAGHIPIHLIGDLEGLFDRLGDSQKARVL